MTDNEAKWHSIFTAADIIGVGSYATDALKIANTSRNVLRWMKPLNRAGTVKMAQETIELSGAVKNNVVGSVMSKDDVADVVLPSHISPVPDVSVGISGDILTKLEAQKRAIVDILNDPITSRLTPEEIEIAKKSHGEQLEKQWGTRIVDIHAGPTDSITGIRSTTISIGKTKGAGGYATEAYATDAANKLGISAYKIIKDTSGQYFINVTEKMPEAGFVLANKIDEVAATNRFLAKYTNPSAWIPQGVLRDFVTAFGTKHRLNKMVRTVLTPEVKNLSFDSKRVLSKVLELGEDTPWVKNGKNVTGKWFTKEELDGHFLRSEGRLPTDKEVLGYYTFKNINDLDYSIRNAWEYTRRARLGYKNVEIPILGDYS